MLVWEAGGVAHTDRTFVSSIDLTGVPGALGDELAGAPVGEPVSALFDAGALVPPFDRTLIREVPLNALRLRPGAPPLRPRLGRFYPSVLAASAFVGPPADRQPLRVVALGEETCRVDLNHPLARQALRVDLRRVTASAHGAGGSRASPLAAACGDGPGMQMRYPGIDSDFFAGGDFARDDETDDRRFYAAPRLVTHIDDTAIAWVTGRYRGLLQADARVLDLMSSWLSHLPGDVPGLQVVGLGMNAQELRRNARLREWRVHDLNRDPALPYGDGEFDAVTCTVSIEYLVQPLAVFAEVARVLKPGGVFVCTLSERCFPTKAIAVWAQLHPFQRMELVLEYFRRTGCFAGLASESVRGLPRPAHDRQAGRPLAADPVYAVWGRRAGGTRPLVSAPVQS